MFITSLINRASRAVIRPAAAKRVIIRLLPKKSFQNKKMKGWEPWKSHWVSISRIEADLGVKEKLATTDHRKCLQARPITSIMTCKAIWWVIVRVSLSSRSTEVTGRMLAKLVGEVRTIDWYYLKHEKRCILIQKQSIFEDSGSDSAGRSAPPKHRLGLLHLQDRRRAGHPVRLNFFRLVLFVFLIIAGIIGYILQDALCVIESLPDLLDLRLVIIQVEAHPFP